MINRIQSNIAAKRDEGASAIEYVLLAALLAVILIVGIVAFGNFLNDSFAETCADVTTAAGFDNVSCTDTTAPQ
jgi:Flp pilus assembly pilin Flp